MHTCLCEESRFLPGKQYDVAIPLIIPYSAGDLAMLQNSLGELQDCNMKDYNKRPERAVTNFDYSTNLL